MDPRLLLFVPLLWACAAAPQGVTVEAMTDSLAEADVVFLGEIHDNDLGHAQQLQILELLHARRPNLALSMEMFSRDVQQALDDYLDGRLDEQSFLETARPWGNYQRHYRPLVEYCREHGLPVIAANVPQEMASRAVREGAEALAGQPFVAREVSLPKGQEWELFEQAMNDAMEEAGGEHGDGQGMDWSRFYEAQCLRDDTMAEAIVDFLRASPADERPLLLHLTGNFHVERRFGTVSRVAQRMPELELRVVVVEDFEPVFPGGEQGDWLLRVPMQPEEEEEEAAEAVEQDHGVEGHGGEGHGSQDSGANP